MSHEPHGAAPRSGTAEESREKYDKSIVVASMGRDKLSRVSLFRPPGLNNAHGLRATGTVPSCLAPGSG